VLKAKRLTGARLYYEGARASPKKCQRKSREKQRRLKTGTPTNLGPDRQVDRTETQAAKVLPQGQTAKKASKKSKYATSQQLDNVAIKKELEVTSEGGQTPSNQEQSPHSKAKKINKSTVKRQEKSRRQEYKGTVRPIQKAATIAEDIQRNVKGRRCPRAKSRDSSDENLITV
jgi:hypothetical protein